VAPRLTQRFALLLDPDVYRELHRRDGEDMVSAAELVRRFITEGLERRAKERGES
jgi:hypothetical protein